jgi:hypothetical protein
MIADVTTELIEKLNEARRAKGNNQCRAVGERKKTMEPDTKGK